MNSDTTITASSLYERALGAYLGFACGDALGATLEFMTQNKFTKLTAFIKILPVVAG